MISENANEIKYLLEDKEIGNIFDIKEGNLVIRVNGKTPDNILLNYTDFKWDGTNDNGQEIKNGKYYIKITTRDKYGHTEVKVKDLTVVKTEEYVRLSIYNTAGEVVRRIEKEKARDVRIDLSVEDVIYIGEGKKIEIEYGNGAYMEWDGKNSEGRLVDSGIYELQIEVKTKEGYSVMATKTVTILKGKEDNILGDVKICPNPFDNKRGSTIRIEWTNIEKGEVNIKIYNIAGELIKKISGKKEKGSVSWNITTPEGKKVTSGIYLVIIEGKDTQGRVKIIDKKLVIIR